ncbi:glutaminyl-peptide cyclotransferase [Alienimonas sp. DA493]|uniref:glutaminyl-peptide cyclotransferase n=1 Tax=Alienimonas sp. DA493 TaxID=3373605 RepID=UPI003754A52A
MTRKLLAAACGLAAVAGLGLTLAAQTADDAAVVRLTPTKRYPHDARAFTQGFAWHDGVLYEGTGRHGTSVLRTVDLETGRTKAFRKLDDRLFGEGVCVLGDEVFQLTWQSGWAFVYDRETLTAKRRFRIAGEGWGLTTDGKRLILSDGSSVLRFLDPATGTVTGRVRVTDRGRPVDQLNELEWVRRADGEPEVLANVWYSPHIARIDPATGEVTGWLDGSELVRLSGVNDREKVLNGIAWDEQGERLLLTGKLWPAVYEVPWPKAP